MTNRIKKLTALLLALLMLTGTALADMRIANNVTALNSHRNLMNNNSALTKNLERLSNGYRINRAGDDEAGLALSELMRSQIAGLAPAQASAREGVSLVQTAEDAWTEVDTMLWAMADLAVQSGGVATSEANGTFSRNMLEDLKQWLAQIGYGQESAGYEPNYDISSGTVDGYLFGMFSSRVDESTMISGFAYGSNVMALFTNRTNGGFEFSQVATDGSSAIIGSDNPMAILVSPNGDIGIVGAGEAYVGAFDGAGNPVGGWNLYTDGKDLYAEPGVELEITLEGEAITTLTLSLGETAQLSVREAEQSAPEKVPTMDWTSMHSDDGVPQNRLEHTINNLGMQTENITAAEARIRDVDITEEMMAYSKNNILVQASQAMLAQANMVPQGVLELLQ